MIQKLFSLSQRPLAYHKRLYAQSFDPAMSTFNAQIKLNPTEKLLAKVCLETANWLKKKNPSYKDLEIRFAGGWVRDKLLKRESNDIDVTVNCMSGAEFALSLITYINNVYNEENAFDPIRTKKFGVVKLNPEKSKHLETATTELLGFGLDFVNLRKETYTSTSRIPQLEIGTPQEDAMRRDANINALFYNLNKDAIEDFTGMALDDLRDGIIRTPIDAYETMLEDPLRVLRLCRFSLKYDFVLADDVIKAITDKTIHEALLSKVSVERIETELTKILHLPNQKEGLLLLDRLGLIGPVFQHQVTNEPQLDHSAIELLDQLLKIPEIKNDEIDVFLAWLACACFPYRKSERLAGKKKRVNLAAYYVGQMKFRNQIVNDIDHLFSEMPAFSSERPNSGMSRVELGLILSRYGKHWRLILILQNIEQHLEEGPRKELNKDLTLELKNLISRIHDLNLQKVYEEKPIVNGKDLIKEGICKPGKDMKHFLDMVWEYQFAHPNASKEEVINYLHLRN